jgi:hypothetical protein
MNKIIYVNNYENKIIKIIKEKVGLFPFVIAYNKEGKYCKLATKLKKIKMARSLYLLINRNINVFKNFRWKTYSIVLNKKAREFSSEINNIILNEEIDNNTIRYLSVCKKTFHKPGEELINYYLTVLLLLNRKFCLDINRYIMKFL